MKGERYRSAIGPVSSIPVTLAGVYLGVPPVANLSACEVLRDRLFRFPNNLQSPAIVTAAWPYVRFIQIFPRELADFGAKLSREPALMLGALIGVVKEAASRSPFETQLHVVLEPVGDE